MAIDINKWRAAGVPADLIALVVEITRAATRIPAKGDKGDKGVGVVSSRYEPETGAIVLTFSDGTELKTEDIRSRLSAEDAQAVQNAILGLSTKADLANSGKTFVSRAVAVSAGQGALPAALGQIETREGDYLVKRAHDATADDPLFATAPRWGVVARIPSSAVAMLPRMTVPNGTDLNTVSLPGKYQLNAAGGYLNAPDLASSQAYWLTVEATGNNTIVRQHIEAVNLSSGGRRQWTRRLNHSSPHATLDAWGESTASPATTAIGYGRAAAAAAKDLNTLLSPGAYMIHPSDGPFANLPADAISSAAYTLEVISYASAAGDSGQYVIQRLSRQNPRGAGTPEAYMEIWQRRVDRKNPGGTTNDAWVKIIGAPASGGSGGSGTVSRPWRVACLGDSLTAGPATGTDRSWASGAAAALGCTVYNFGIGGSRATELGGGDRVGLSFAAIARAIASGDWSGPTQAAAALFASDGTDYRSRVAQMAALDWATVTHATIFYGTNDFRGSSTAGVPLGTPTDTDGTASFWGAMNSGLDAILTARPNIQLVLVTPPYRNSITGIVGDSDTAVNGNGHSLQDYAEAIRGAADARHLPVIDLNRTSGINARNHALYLSDGLHPWSVEGQAHMVSKMSAGLKAHFG